MRRLADIDPGIVDEDIDPAKLLPHPLDHGIDRRLISDVGNHRDCLDAALPEIGDGIVRLRLIACDNCNIRSGIGEPARHAETDTAIAAGDDRYFVAEVE